MSFQNIFMIVDSNQRHKKKLTTKEFEKTGFSRISFASDYYVLLP